MNPINVPALASRAHPVVQISDGKAITTSVEVARVFDKQHRHVLDSIRTLVAQLPDEGVPNFRQTPYTDPQNGQTYPAYHLTRDGFTLLAMGFTGKRALAFKLAYIDAFNKMEAALHERAQSDHIVDADKMVEHVQSAPEPHKVLSPAVAQEIAAQASQSILDALQRQNMLVDWSQVIDALTDRNTTITFYELTDLIHAALNRLQRAVNSEAYECIARRAAKQGVSTAQVSLNA